MNENFETENTDDGKLVEKYIHMKNTHEKVFFDSEEFEQLVDHFLEKSDVDEVLRIINYGFEIYPNNYFLRLRHAQILGLNGKIRHGISVLDDLVEEYPSEQEIFVSRSSLYAQINEYQKAINDLLRVVDMVQDEEEDELCLTLALLYQKIDKNDIAKQYLEKGLDINPSNEAILYEMTFLFSRNQNEKDGIGFFEDFLEKNPYSSDGWFNLGNLYVAKNNHEKAIWCFDFCTAIEEYFNSAHFNKANSLVHLKKYEQAIETYKLTLEDEDYDSITLNHIGDCYEKLEDFPKAMEYYERALEYNEFFPEAWINKGVMYDAEEKWAESIACFDKALKLDPDDIDNVKVLITAYIKHDLFESKIADFNELLDFRNSIEDFSNFIDYLISLAEYELTLLLLSENSYQAYGDIINHKKIVCYYKLGNINKAREIFSLLLEKNSINKDFLINIAPEIFDRLNLFNFSQN